MKKILVVDDSPVVRSFHINILKTAGFEADGAIDGMDALEKSLIQSYNAVICDINMPNMDGLTYIRRFREVNQKLPIIILSTQEEEIHRKKSYEAGANLFIVKPVKPEKLILHINILLGDIP